MEEATLWFLVVGGLFITMALAGSLLRRILLSSAIIYLAIGFGLGPHGLALLDLDFQRDADILEILTEIAVIISLFTTGLKLRAPLTSRAWLPALRLSTIGMIITVGLVALVGNLVFGFSLGAAVLLGAVMSPTDPVLASDVQTRHPYDQDRLRFSLTAEAGLNDGTAFPFVMLGLGLLGLHSTGPMGLRWIGVDVVWATAAGLCIGALLGTLVGKLILHLRRDHKEAVGLDDFLTLGLIALSYGLALYLNAYGFLAVFAAGLALRHLEQTSSADAAVNHHQNDVANDRPEPDTEKQILTASTDEVSPLNDMDSADEIAATDPEKAPAYMARAMLHFNESLERIAEVALVVCVGCLLDLSMLTWEALAFVLILMFIIRPVAVWLSLLRSGTSRERFRLIAWFGVRGIGSLYYLAYALTHNLGVAEGQRLADFTLIAVAVSVVVHGTTVTPLMSWYGRKRTETASDH